MSNDLPEPIQKAKEQLDEAVLQVAQSAQMLAGAAEYIDKDTVSVSAEEMDELKEALKVWNQASQNFLAEVKKAGG